MPTIRIPRLVRPGVLFGLKRASIHALLSPYADYFAARGAPLSEITDEGKPLDGIVSVITSPVESTPPDLVERLELLDLISDPQSVVNFEDGYGRLVENYLEEGDSSTDLAVKILIHAPDVAWREFDRQALQARRSLVSFSVRPGLKFLPPNARRIDRFRELVIPWFQANARSGICHVHFREEANGVSFVIRHGDLLKRIGVYDENGNSGSRILRPERVDVAHYRHLTGEWQVSGLGLRLQEIYRQAFGTVFHGSAHALGHSKRYSLEPLREGPACLQCQPGSRIQVAELASLKIVLPCGTHVTLGRGDVFAAIRETNPMLLQIMNFLEARIDLKIAARRRMVPIILSPLRDKVSGIHLDDAIEPWLAERGFSNNSHEGFVLESA
jgi:hypothetical protein